MYYKKSRNIKNNVSPTSLISRLLMFWLFLLPLNAISDVVPESVLSDWGYEKNPHEKYMEDYCKVAETPVSSAYQGIRGLPKSKTDKDTRWLRFTLAKETYATEQDAQAIQLALSDASGRGSKYSKMCTLRKGFVRGKDVYFVHTDVGKYSDYIDAMLEKLEKHLISLEKSN